MGRDATLATDSWRAAVARFRGVRLAAGLALLAWSCSAAPPTQPAGRASLSLSENPIEITRRALDETDLSVLAVLYKFDEPSLLPALVAAVERGVEVRLLVDAAQAGGEGEESLVESARASGASVRFWSRKLGKLHAKFTVLDGRRALAGSYNWTQSARTDNVELLLDFENAETVSRLIDLFDQLWRRAGETAEE